MLRYAIAPSFISWAKRKKDNPYDFSQKIGDELDGYANHATIYPYLKDKVKFPDGFKISSDEKDYFDSTDLK